MHVAQQQLIIIHNAPSNDNLGKRTNMSETNLLLQLLHRVGMPLHIHKRCRVLKLLWTFDQQLLMKLSVVHLKEIRPMSGTKFFCNIWKYYSCTGTSTCELAILGPRCYLLHVVLRAKYVYSLGTAVSGYLLVLKY